MELAKEIKQLEKKTEEVKVKQAEEPVAQVFKASFKMNLVAAESAYSLSIDC